MEETLYLVIGIIVFLAVFYDFFYTTLSSSGAAFLTKNCSLLLHKCLLRAAKIFGRKVFNLSGIWMNLPMLFLWLILFWLSSFLIFSYNPGGVVSSSGVMASAVERWYFSGYVFSTMGLGNFKPVTPFFEIFTSGLSFLGFVIITTSMTYFISVSSAVIEKRSIALLIRSLGEHPQEVIESILRMKSSTRGQQFSSIQQKIVRHTTSHQSYPVIHFYNTPKLDSSLSVNLSVLDEAISIILQSEQLQDLHSEVDSLRKSISIFLNHVQEKYNIKAESDPEINWQNLNLPKDVQQREKSAQNDLRDRRKLLTGLLKGEDWDWKQVYPGSVMLPKE